jgi:hypothetical protein
MKTFDITGTGVKIDVVAIEWPTDATALVHESGAFMCRTTDPDESKERKSAFAALKVMKVGWDTA